MSHKTNVSLYSFDVFDTVLTRAVADPKDVFLLMQRKLENSSLSLPGKMIKDFKSIRVKCESGARRLSDKEDIKIDDIYRYMGDIYELSQGQILFLQDLELKTEHDLTCPVSWTISEINKLRKAGTRVIFISDMYLPESNVKEMLARAGAYRDGDKMYISGKIGLTKASGNLFRYVLEREKCEPYQMCHCGNNLYSDVYVSSKMGICIYKTSGEDLRKILRHSRLYAVKRKIFGFLRSLFFKH